MSRICSIEGCSRKLKARGWCDTHYARWKKHGDVNKVGSRHYESVHGHAVGNGTPTYVAWRAMRQRCQNPNDAHYADYGGRGISVDSRWDSYDAFLADVGERPPNPPGYEGKRAYWSLDRIDNDGNYEPGNVRWATQSEQNSNRRSALDGVPDE